MPSRKIDQFTTAGSYTSFASQQVSERANDQFKTFLRALINFSAACISLFATQAKRNLVSNLRVCTHMLHRSTGTVFFSYAYHPGCCRLLFVFVSSGFFPSVVPLVSIVSFIILNIFVFCFVFFLQIFFAHLRCMLVHK